MLSLISSLVTNPTALIFLLLISGGLFRKWKVVKRTLWGMALVLTLLFTNQPLYDSAYRKWFAEYDHPLPEGKTYEYGIVLGGYSHWDWERNRIEFSNIADLTDTPVKVGDRKPSWVPSLAVLLRWPELLHEWVGYAYYAWKGNI